MTNSSIDSKSDLIRRDPVLGSRRLSNYWWATVILVGASGFFLVGISSYFGFNLVPFIKSEEILFIPQGLVMSFYGVAGILLSVYLWLTIIWNVGEGYNEYNKQDGIVRIFRWGFPGKNRRIDLVYPIQDVQAIRVEIKEGINPRRVIYLKIKGKREIPLTRIGQPLTLGEIEEKAANLARFLQVSIEGL
uniref:Photosystem I assembly protein Ycf4 n=1 Tax=Chlorokybus atmophyticus TaxID=3144 RepID=YCF4_CHLAT|nr:photosystem I assembly protein Ycf4 [Chlorokybus atmophyticus]Q19V70.2 RecName: Full=Photosystem I assembly protein Ycf4 [Chlorokybus atmophyticus]ABD62262.2 hypothetical chloroplast RF4 [Chlorokybus atmophyticus]WKT05643.1 hypothetical chloroplast RF4 [Chlorokybus atmophyticus]